MGTGFGQVWVGFGQLWVLSRQDCPRPTLVKSVSTKARWLSSSMSFWPHASRVQVWLFRPISGCLWPKLSRVRPNLASATLEFRGCHKACWPCPSRPETADSELDIVECAQSRPLDPMHVGLGGSNCMGAEIGTHLGLALGASTPAQVLEEGPYVGPMQPALAGPRPVLGVCLRRISARGASRPRGRGGSVGGHTAIASAMDVPTPSGRRNRRRIAGLRRGLAGDRGDSRTKSSRIARGTSVSKVRCKRSVAPRRASCASQWALACSLSSSATAGVSRCKAHVAAMSACAVGIYTAQCPLATPCRARSRSAPQGVAARELPPTAALEPREASGAAQPTPRTHRRHSPARRPTSPTNRSTSHPKRAKRALRAEPSPTLTCPGCRRNWHGQATSARSAGTAVLRARQRGPDASTGPPRERGPAGRVARAVQGRPSRRWQEAPVRVRAERMCTLRRLCHGLRRGGLNDDRLESWIDHPGRWLAGWLTSPSLERPSSCGRLKNPRSRLHAGIGSSIHCVWRRLSFRQRLSPVARRLVATSRAPGKG